MLAYENGVNYFDTAYIYPGSEAAIGEIFERNSKQYCRFNHNNVEIVAVCDINPNALEKAKADYNLSDDCLFTDYKDLIDSGKCDIVDIFASVLSNHIDRI